MTRFNEKHEAIIFTRYRPVGHTIPIKDGDIVSHKQQVTRIKTYLTDRDDNGKEHITKILLSRDFILDMAAQIEQLESDVKDMPYDSLPF